MISFEGNSILFYQIKKFTFLQKEKISLEGKFLGYTRNALYNGRKRDIFGEKFNLNKFMLKILYITRKFKKFLHVFY